ncbi:MAG: phosphoribosylamine--glycine ligase [Acidimicrobiaceae bacterium]|nr:phosphoribosylamine--glycine ligase [Acidimicrobiaceae bacterium]
MSCVLVVGGGGREHALAWALNRSRHVERIIAAPGNPGIAACDRAENAPVAAGDTDGLVELCRRESVDLVAVGPEGPLAAGLVDALGEAQIAAFGPDGSCARLEASKAHCKQFLIDNGIPTAPAHVFRDAGEALAHLRARPDVPVVKASGLAAGKGVIVPSTRQEAAEAVEAMLVGGRFGTAGSEILLEERLEGRELSVLAFCDGEHFAVLPPAQDHKRLLEGDRGPNTGGMGAVAPSPAADQDLVAEVRGRIIAPTLSGLRRAGTPYRGVLYAGLMLTAEGPKVIEFNCRFGDPEAQAVLPLLRSDLYEIMLASATGSLDGVAIDWAPEACVAVVMASAGYPDSTADPAPITGLDGAADAGCVVFHAGTGTIDGGLHATGGRVLAVTAVGPDVEAAARKAHRGVAAIDFEGAQHRADIGLALAGTTPR